MTAKVSENTERACGHVSSCPPPAHLSPRPSPGRNRGRVLVPTGGELTPVLHSPLEMAVSLLICENYEGGKHRNRARCVIPNANRNSKRQNICSKITQENACRIVNSITKVISPRQPGQGVLQCSLAPTPCASCATSQSLWCLSQCWDWVPHFFPLPSANSLISDISHGSLPVTHLAPIPLA